MRADQTALKRYLVCAFAFRMQQNQLFLRRCPFSISLTLLTSNGQRGHRLKFRFGHLAYHRTWKFFKHSLTGSY